MLLVEEDVKLVEVEAAAAAVVALVIHQPLVARLPRFGPVLELLILAILHLQVVITAA